jgi:hypothetical protein
LHSFDDYGDEDGDGDEDEDEDEDDESGEGGDDDYDDVDESSMDEGEAGGHALKSREEDVNQIDDKNAGACNGHSAVRTFMKGMVGDEDRLQYRDQVELVATFCEQPTFRESGKCVALLDDRNDGGIVFEEKQGPLDSVQLRGKLSTKVAISLCSNRISRDTDSMDSVSATYLPTYLMTSQMTRREGCCELKPIVS